MPSVARSLREPHTFHGYYSNFRSCLFIVVLLINRNRFAKRKLSVGIYFDLGFFSSPFIFTRDGHKAGQNPKNRAKSKSNQSRLVQFVTFRSRSGKLVEISGTSAKINVKPFVCAVSISQASRACVCPRSVRGARWRDK